MRLLHKSLAPVARFASDNANRFALNGILVETLKDNGVRVTASDGKRLIRATQAHGLDPADFPVIPGFDSTQNGVDSALIPAESWSKAFKAIPKKTHIPILENLALTISGNPKEPQINYAATDLATPTISSTKWQEGNFPDVDAVFPTSERVIALRVNPRTLGESLIAIADIVEHKQRYGSAIGDVMVSIYGKDTAIRLDAENQITGIKVEVLVMPLQGMKP